MISASSTFSSTLNTFSQIYQIFDNVVKDILNVCCQASSAQNNAENNFKNNSIFDLKNPPQISIIKYIKRINKQVNFSEDEILIALILIDRLGINNLQINSHNIHKIILGLLRVISKFNHDIVVENKIFAQIAGISIEELNQIELEILKILNFQLYIDATELNEYKSQIFQYYQNLSVHRELQS